MTTLSSVSFIQPQSYGCNLASESTTPDQILIDQLKNGYDPKVIEDLYETQGELISVELSGKLLEEAVKKQDTQTVRIILEEPLLSCIEKGIGDLTEFFRLFEHTIPIDLFQSAFLEAAKMNESLPISFFLQSSYLQREDVKPHLPKIIGEAFVEAVSAEACLSIHELLQNPSLIKTRYLKQALHLPGGHRKIFIFGKIYQALSPKQTDQQNFEDLEKALLTCLDYNHETTARYIIDVYLDAYPIHQKKLDDLFLKSIEKNRVDLQGNIARLGLLKAMSKKCLQSAYSLCKSEELRSFLLREIKSRNKL